MPVIHYNPPEATRPNTPVEGDALIPSLQKYRRLLSIPDMRRQSVRPSDVAGQERDLPVLSVMLTPCDIPPTKESYR